MKARILVAVFACAMFALSVGAEAGEKVVIQLGHGQTIVQTSHKALELMAAEAAKLSNGSLEIQIFPANQLGNERDLAESLTQDILDMAWISTAVMENFDSKMAMFSLPYVFRSFDHVKEVTESEVGDFIFGSLLETNNIRVLGFFDQGFRWVWNNTRPIVKLEDIKGVKIRAPESPVYMGTFRLLGANPTPIPWGEVYTAMQTKVVDGFEVYPESFVANKSYEVCKYGSRTNHIYAGSVLMIREGLWEELSPEHQDILRKTAKIAENWNRDTIVSNDENYLNTLRENGMELNDISEAELDRFADAVAPLYEDYHSRLGDPTIIKRARDMYKPGK